MNFLRQNTILAAIGLLIIVLLAFSVNLNRLGLYSDDWVFMNGSVAQGWDYNSGYLTSPRPLHVLHWTLASALFGIDLLPRYLLQIGALWGNSLLLFLLLACLLPDFAGFAFLTAALFAVYPTVTTQLWLSAQPLHLVVGLLLLSLLIFSYSLYHYRTSVGYRLNAVAAIIFLFSLMFYEAHICLIAVAPWLGVAVRRQTNQRIGFINLLWWSAPYLTVVLVYLVYRFVVIPALGWVDPRAESWVIDPALLWAKFLQMRGTVTSVWWLVLERVLFTSGTLTVGTGIAAAVISGVFGFVVSQRGGGSQAGETQTKFPVIWLVGTGGWLLVLGYLPILPTVYWIAWPTNFASRVGYPATIGAALLLTSIIWWAGQIAARFLHRPVAVPLFVGGVSLLVGLGSAHSYYISLDYARSWQLQKQVYSNLEQLVPTLVDDTFVFLIGPPRDVGVARGVVSLSGSLKLLYQNYTVDGRNTQIEDGQIYTEAGPVSFTKQGAVLSDHTAPIAPSRFLFIEYNKQGCLQMVQQIQVRDADHDFSVSSNTANILPAPTLSYWFSLIQTNLQPSPCR